MHVADFSNLSSENIGKGVSADQEEEPVAIGASSTPETRNINSDSAVSFAASAETQVIVGNDVPNLSKSPSYCDNRNDYSSMVGHLACLLLFFLLFNIGASNCGWCFVD